MKKLQTTILAVALALLSIFSACGGDIPQNGGLSGSSDLSQSVSDSSFSPPPVVYDGVTATYEREVEKGPTSDPYTGVSKTEFYKNYAPATSNEDAYYRSQHGFLSGNITVPDPAPIVATNAPKKGDKFVRNAVMEYSEDGNTYFAVDERGNYAFTVFKDGAYITLEEVAAYVYAFGTYPKNHSSKKSTKPTSSIWAEYLRVNHSNFSGDTSRYPYEPVLPNISGCGGTLQYYEMDIGTTGTKTDGYPVALYNNGSKITRGAARIVYGKRDIDGDGILERGEFHLFYTYNHYNDFQEYLGYQGGWGAMFGNITGGGVLSSETNYNPTPYIETVWGEI